MQPFPFGDFCTDLGTVREPIYDHRLFRLDVLVSGALFFRYTERTFADII